MNGPPNPELRAKLAKIPIGPKMQACSDMERAFAFCLGSGIAKSAAEAARLAGYSKPYKQSAYQVQHKPRVVEAIEEVCRSQFRGLVPHVIAAAKALVLDKDHPDHAKTVISLLSRMGYGEKASVDINVSGEVTLSHTDAAVEDLRRMKSLGFSRDQLIEAFGHTGLSHFEKLLAQRTPRAIEHIPNEDDQGSAPDRTDEPATMEGANDEAG